MTNGNKTIPTKTSTQCPPPEYSLQFRINLQGKCNHNKCSSPPVLPASRMCSFKWQDNNIQCKSYTHWMPYQHVASFAFVDYSNPMLGDKYIDDDSNNCWTGIRNGDAQKVNTLRHVRGMQLVSMNIRILSNSIALITKVLATHTQTDAHILRLKEKQDENRRVARGVCQPNGTTENFNWICARSAEWLAMLENILSHSSPLK